jgi:hypothetical protein
MAEKAKIDSMKDGIEPKIVKSEVTPRVDTRDIDSTENAVFDSSELNSLMDSIDEKFIRPILTEEINFEELEETAAGLSGGSGGDGSTFVRLLRVVEGVDPLSYNYGFEPNEIPDFVLRGIDDVNEEPEIPPNDDPQDPEQPEDPKDPPEDEDDDGPPVDPEVPDDEDPDEEDDDPDNPPPPPDDDEDDDPDVDPPDGDKGKNNGWGNGDQDAPGNSGPNNNAENSDADNPLEKERGNGTSNGNNNGGGNPNSDSDGDVTRNNPGNDRQVGGAPWDGETGSSGKPGKGNHQDGIDVDENQPGGKDKGQNLDIADLLSDNSYEIAVQHNFPQVDVFFPYTKPISLE